MYCNETAVLGIDTVYKQSKNYHPTYMLECLNTLKYTDAESQQFSMLGDSDDDGYIYM